MPRSRKTLISLETTSYYHCSSRCVRRAFLCGEDPISGQSFEHRRQWIEDKLLFLAEIFALDLCAYAVMHNHYHVVLFVDKASAENWDKRQVISRWHQLFKGNTFSQRYLKGELLTTEELAIIDSLVELWRARLMNISWFMRIINEGIARRSNKEDHCTGRFWEGRFNSQALLDEKALIACAAYVDLNPIRARIATGLSDSTHTSIQRRCQQAKLTHQPNHPNQQAPGLLPCVGNIRQNMPKGLPIRLTDYLELVDWTGKIQREDKRGDIATSAPPILDQLQIDPKHWCYLCQNFESRFKNLVGASHHVQRACQQLGLRWTHGIKACREAFPA